jgi:hypothetical protein
MPKINAVNAFKSLLFTIAAIMVGACAGAPPKPAAPPPQAKAVELAPKPAAMPTLPAAYIEKGVSVKIDGLWLAPDGEILGVNGTAKNVTASDLRFCLISLAFLDQAGLKLDAAKASKQPSPIHPRRSMRP